MDADASPASGPPSSRREPAPGAPRGSGPGREGAHVCVFWLAGRRYALDTVVVTEALTLAQLVTVPLSPPWLVGLTSLRGAAVPVVSLSAVLGLPADATPVEPGELPRSLVLRVDGTLLAAVVDRTEAVYGTEGARLDTLGGVDAHAGSRGLLDIGPADVPATLLDHAELARRLSALRFRAKWDEGPGGETRDGAHD
ncbi:MAG: chemotaxis protein CheW [Vicinamibacteria bacterium]